VATSCLFESGQGHQSILAAFLTSATSPIPTATDSDINQLLAATYQNHGAGRLPEAERLYQQILAADHAMALQALGMLQFQTDREDAAVALLRRLVAANRGNADFHHNLAVALRATARLEEAATHFVEAARLKPGFAEAHFELGNLFAGQEKWTEAAEQYQRAAAINPRFAEAHTNLGNVQVRHRIVPPAAEPGVFSRRSRCREALRDPSAARAGALHRSH
jgi:tetratricopeptide (TPR) repeat protein